MQNSPAKTLLFLRQPEWWQQARQMLTTALPVFLLPAAGLGFANILLLWGLYQGSQIMYQSEITMEMLTQACLLVLACTAGGLFLSLWMLSSWLMKLTAWAKLCLSHPSGKIELDDFKKCLKDISSRKWQLSKLWLVASVYLLVPVLLLTVILVVQILLPSAIIAPPPQMALVKLAINVIIIILAIAITGYSLILMVLAAQAKLPAGQANLRCLQILWQERNAILLLSAIVVATNVLISTPQVLWGQTSTAMTLTSESLSWQIAQQAWLSLTSTILWPWSVMSFSQFLQLEAQ